MHYLCYLSPDEASFCVTSRIINRPSCETLSLRAGGMVMSVYFSSPSRALRLPGERQRQDKLVLSDNAYLCHSSIPLPPCKMGTLTSGGGCTLGGVALSHLSSLKVAHHQGGTRKINIDSSANLCIHHCCDAGSARVSSLLALCRLRLSRFPSLSVVKQQGRLQC